MLAWATSNLPPQPLRDRLVIAGRRIWWRGTSHSIPQLCISDCGMIGAQRTPFAVSVCHRHGIRLGAHNFAELKTKKLSPALSRYLSFDQSSRHLAPASAKHPKPTFDHRWQGNGLHPDAGTSLCKIDSLSGRKNFSTHPV